MGATRSGNIALPQLVRENYRLGEHHGSLFLFLGPITKLSIITHRPPTPCFVFFSILSRPLQRTGQELGKNQEIEIGNAPKMAGQGWQLGLGGVWCKCP